ncbi:ImmA/IrrE family metallo-endopeptidase [Ihubacter sp. rT4E-8]|uniref:ImmA/IrrE family metallo-endopeptidase n=1 Tax=unclassified Ihubacter TaxID=2633299 RepID=UPI00137A2FCB
MSKYEDLLMEYEDKLLIEERNMKNEGLYGDNVAWINKNLPSRRKTCILAEEIGHYETSVGDILDQHSLDSAKQERAARGWAFNKLIPLDDIKDAYRKGYREYYEMAEFLDIDEEFLRDSVAYYESKYGDLWQEEKEARLIDALMRGRTTG